MKKRSNYYRKPGVQLDAQTQIILTRYLTLMRWLENHPDLGGRHVDASLLYEAYDVLEVNSEKLWPGMMQGFLQLGHAFSPSVSSAVKYRCLRRRYSEMEV